VAYPEADGVVVVDSVTGTWQGWIRGGFWGESDVFKEDVFLVLVEVSGGGITGSMRTYNRSSTPEEEGYVTYSIVGMREDTEFTFILSPTVGLRGCYFSGTVSTSDRMSGTLDCPYSGAGEWELTRVR